MSDLKNDNQNVQKCYIHSNNNACTTCEVCKRYICNECLDKVEAIANERVNLCFECYEKLIQNEILEIENKRRSDLIFLIIMSVCYLIALLNVSSNGNPFVSVLLWGIWWYICGWNWVQSVVDTEIKMFGESYKTVIDDDGNGITKKKIPHIKYLVILSIIGFFGIFTTPVLIIKRLIALLMLNHKINEIKKSEMIQKEDLKGE